MDDFSIVNNDDMTIVSKKIGKDANKLGRKLDLEDGVLGSLFLDNDKYGNEETTIKMLTKWKQMLGDDARCELLAEKLESIDRADIATTMLKSHFPGEGTPTSAKALAYAKNPSMLDDKSLQTATPVSGKDAEDAQSLSSYSVSASCQLSSATWEDYDINDEVDCDKCWLCSIGGYYKIQLSRLLELTTMKRAATVREIIQFYKANGARVKPWSFLDWNLVSDYLRNRLVRGAKLKVALVFDVKNELIRHMVVLKALRTQDDQILYRVIDFQKAPNDPLRKTDNKLPDNAKNPFLIFETDHDVYESPPIKTSLPSI